MNQRSQGIVIAGVLVAASIVVAAILISRTIESEAETTRQTIDDAADHAVVRQVEGASQDLARGGQESIEALGDVAGSVLGGVLGRQGTEPITDDRPPPAEPSGSLLGDLFGAGQRLGRSVDEAVEKVVRLSDEEESDIGKKVHEVFHRRQSVIRDDAQTNRLRRLAEPYLQSRTRPAIEYTFTVVNDPDVNAFAHLGGYVYINSGLIALTQTDQELQSVIGHEIAHVDLRHCARKTTYAVRAAEFGGELARGLVEAGYQTISVAYSEEDELEADRWSVEQLPSVQPHAIRFLQRLAELEPAPQANAPEKSTDMAAELNRELEGHFRTHPPTAERIESIKRIK